ncbi:MAG: polyphenol oxidase family protein [Muribaculaceae bacterium]|nr:polyphenol oxidase family protein [Muribaculaceae bacterium]
MALVSDGNEMLEDTDAIITVTPGLPIGVRTADCVPVILYAGDIKAVAAVHAGWKGTLGGIVDVVVDRLADMGSDPRNIHATFGISICGNCYEVDNDLAEWFIKNGFSKCVSYPCGEEGKPCVDLQGANTLRLVSKGVDRDNICNNTLCTRSTKDAYGNPLFHSWRRTPGTPGRNITFAYLRI